VALFHQLSWKTSKISAMLDFQFRHVFYRGLGDFWERDLSAFQSNFNFFNPKFSMHFQLNPIHSLYLFGGLGHKEPNRNDILDNVNKPVKSEQLYNLELAYQLTKKNISFKTNFFGMYFIDQLVLTGRINEIGAYIRENVPQSYRFGLELAYEQKISPKWSLNSNFTAMRSIIPTYYHYIYAYNEAFQIQHEFTKIDTLKYTTQSFSPETIAFADLNFTPHPNSKLSLQGKLTSAQFLDNTQNEKAKIPSFFVLNANYKQDFPMNKNKCSIQFQLNNILNSSYVSSGYTYGSGNSVVSNILLPTNTPINYYFPQAGLNVLISLQYQW
jgi:iron complex outermembrane receptor protein